jgi:hypothetical protein
MRRALLFAFCLSLTRAAIAQEGFPLFTTDFPPEEFASRRAGVYDAIGKGAVAILQGAPTATGYTRFRQRRPPLTAYTPLFPAEGFA